MRPALLVALLAFPACEPNSEPPRAGEGEGEGEGEVEGSTIAVAPAVCDFGPVTVGAIRSCTIGIQNVGVRDLVVDGTELFIDAGEPGNVQDLAIVRVADALSCVEDLTDGDVDDDCP